MKKSGNEFYKKGLAIYLGDKMYIGIHPDNLENNLEHLIKGTMRFDWSELKRKYDKTANVFKTRDFFSIYMKGEVVLMIECRNLSEFLDMLANGIGRIDWEVLTKHRPTILGN